MTNTSAISMIPALIACTSSPIPGTRTTMVTPASRAISTSSCPTPTVSTITTSRPAASNSIVISVVARAKPPSHPRVAIERMKTPSSA